MNKWLTVAVLSLGLTLAHAADTDGAQSNPALAQAQKADAVAKLSLIHI